MQKMQRDSKGRFIKQNKEEVKKDKIVTPSNKENKPEVTSYSYEYSYKKIGDNEPEVSGKYVVTDSNGKNEQVLSREEILNNVEQRFNKIFNNSSLFSNTALSPFPSYLNKVPLTLWW